MTVMGKENGRRKIVARIFREYDSVLKQMKYTAKDREGKEIFPEITSLYDLKKKFVENAKQLAQQIPAPEKNEPAQSAILPEQQQPKEKGEKKSIGKKLKDKAQELTHSLVPEKMLSEDPVRDSVIEGMQREEELKGVREKNNGKGKELTR